MIIWQLLSRVLAGFMFLVTGHLLWYGKKFELLSHSRNLFWAQELFPLCQKIKLAPGSMKNIIYSSLSQIQYTILRTCTLYNKYDGIYDWLIYSKAFYLQCLSSCSQTHNNGLIFWSPARITAAVRKHSACSSVTGTIEEKIRGKKKKINVIIVWIFQLTGR